MFDMGFLEILVVGAIALIVIGPDKLPAVARKVGFWVGKTQRFVAGVKSDIADELQADELRNMLKGQEDQIRELKTMVSDAKTDFERSSKEVHKSVTETVDGAIADVKNSSQENSERMQKIARDAGYDVFDEKTDVSDADSATAPNVTTNPQAADNDTGSDQSDDKANDQNIGKSA